MSSIPKGIRAILVCPRCRGELRDARSAEGDALECPKCRLSYPVVDGIPVLLSERAKPATS